MKPPKEKAKELIDKFFDYVGAMTCNQQNENAKKCALISIENEIETIESLIKLCNSDNFMKIHLDNKLQELQNVKSEIEKL